MKTYHILFCLILLTISSLKATAQASSIEPEKPQISCRQVTFLEDNQRIIFEENVSFKTPKFELVKGEKVIYDQKTRKMIIFGPQEFIIDGRVIAPNTSAPMSRVEYTLGEDVAYVY